VKNEKDQKKERKKERKRERETLAHKKHMELEKQINCFRAQHIYSFVLF